MKALALLLGGALGLGVFAWHRRAAAAALPPYYGAVPWTWWVFHPEGGLLALAPTREAAEDVIRRWPEIVRLLPENQVMPTTGLTAIEIAQGVPALALVVDYDGALLFLIYYYGANRDDLALEAYREITRERPELAGRLHVIETIVSPTV